MVQVASGSMGQCCPSWCMGTSSRSVPRAQKSWAPHSMMSSPSTPVLPIAAWVSLDTALLAGGLITCDVPYALAVDEELSAAGTADRAGGA